MVKHKAHIYRMTVHRWLISGNYLRDVDQKLLLNQDCRIRKFSIEVITYKGYFKRTLTAAHDKNEI